MSDRITKADLNQLAESITRATGERHFVQWAYNRPRLMKDAKRTKFGQGVYDVSPRLPSRALYEWMHSFLDGIYAGRSRRR